MDDSPDGTGRLSVVAEVVGKRVGIYGLTDVTCVLDEADGGLHDRDFGPGIGDHPVLRRKR